MSNVFTTLLREQPVEYVMPHRRAAWRRASRAPTFTGEPLRAWHRAVRDRLHAAAAARGVTLVEFLRAHPRLSTALRVVA